MAETQTKLFAFIDNVRLSSWAMKIEDPRGEHARLPGHNVEAGRTHDIAGLLADSGTFEAHVPQATDYERMFQLRENRATVIWSLGSGTTLGDEYRVSRINLLDFGETKRPQPMFTGGYSVVEHYHQALGALRYYNNALAATEDGTSFQIAGGLAAGEKILVNVHPYARAGSTPASMTVKFRSASDEPMTTPTDEIAFTAITDTGGGAALRGEAQHGTLDGDDAVITNTWFDVSISALTAGTWGLAVTVSKFTK